MPTSQFTREFYSLMIPEWKNEYVDYPTIRGNIVTLDAEKDEEKRNNMIHDLLEQIIPKEIEKVNKFFKRTEEKYTKKHGELKEKGKLLEDVTLEWKKLKMRASLIRAYQEHNKALNFLKNYKDLNHTVILRLLHKIESVGYEKVQKTIDRIEKEYFWTSTLVDFMLKDLEKYFARLFDDNHKVAHDKLNTIRDEYFRAQNIWRSGAWCGITLSFFILCIFFYFNFYINLSLPYGSNSINLFKILVFPNVLMIFLSINLFIWNNNYINYVFIFDLDPTKRISKYQFLEIAMLSNLIFLIHFFSYMYLAYTNVANAWAVPIAMYILYFVWVILPFNILYRSARYWMIEVILRNLFAPFVSVKFKDFFMGDQLTSLSDFLFGIQFAMCIYPAMIDPNTNVGCNNYISLGLPVLTLWPNLARFLQCLRRYRDDPTKFHPHMVNAGKYLSSIIAILLNFIDVRIIGNGKPYSEWNWARTLWIIVNIISSFYKLAYDLLMDWGLFSFVFGKKDSKYFLLKKQLLFHPIWYYFAIIINTVIRFLWIIMIVINFYLQPEIRRLGVNLYLDIVLGVIELFRRFVWNIFRLENEQLSNIDQYRVTVDVPLPFERHSLIKERTSRFEAIEDILFKFCPFLLRDNDPLLEYEINMDEFIKKTTKTILGRKETLMKQDFHHEKTNEVIDDDDLKIDKDLPRIESDLRFDTSGDTKIEKDKTE